MKNRLAQPGLPEERTSLGPVFNPQTDEMPEEHLGSQGLTHFRLVAFR